jgi:hypothetical protein
MQRNFEVNLLGADAADGKRVVFVDKLDGNDGRWPVVWCCLADAMQSDMRCNVGKVDGRCIGARANRL